MNILLVILDGLADRHYEELGGQTPLQAASTPNLDELARSGRCGLMHTIAPGLAPSSDQAHFVLFGYPLSQFPGRGYLEALGEDKPPAVGEIVLRASFVTAREKEDTLEIVSRENPTLAAEEELTSAVADTEISGVKLRFVYTGGRQGLLFLKGKVSSDITDSDPFAPNLPVLRVQARDDASEKELADKTANVLNRFLLETYARIRDRRLNFLVTKWAGRLRKLDSFELKLGLKGACLGSGPLYRGLALAVGLDHFEVGENLSAPGDDLRRRLARAEVLFAQGYDFVHVHTKAADHAAHTKNPGHKKETIEQLDRAFSLLLKTKPWEGETLVVVTSDHATPSRGPLIHSGEPSPLMMLGANAGRDEVQEWSEPSCSQGSLGTVRGQDLVPLILNATDQIRFLGHRPHVKDFLAPPTAANVVPLRLSS